MASVLTRAIGPLVVMYVPKGPALDYGDPALLAGVLDHLQALARKRFALWLKIDPDVIGGTGVPGERMIAPIPGAGGNPGAPGARLAVFRRSGAVPQHGQPGSDSERRRSAGANEPEYPAQGAHGGQTSGHHPRGDPGGPAHALSALPGHRERDAFLIRPPDYYEKAWRDFMQAGLAQALIAEYQGTAIAQVILFHFGPKCWYFYGASSNQERHRMPNYALQWAAMQWAKAQGYTVYDLWGAPNEFVESDSLWGGLPVQARLPGYGHPAHRAWIMPPIDRSIRPILACGRGCSRSCDAEPESTGARRLL